MAAATKLTREWLENIIKRDMPYWRLAQDFSTPDKYMNETFIVKVIKTDGAEKSVIITNGLVSDAPEKKDL